MNQRLRKVLATHRTVTSFKPGNKAYARCISLRLVEPFLLDSEAGDITTRAMLPSSTRVIAHLVAKQPGVLAGMQELLFFLTMNRAGGRSRRGLFENVKVLHPSRDGSLLRNGTVIAKLQGSAADILKLERTILNFLQHMSGVATMAAAFVKKAGADNVLLCPTRKTPWGLLDKRACVLGGGGTHRLNLGDAILVKDTHLDLLSHDFTTVYHQLMTAPSLGRFVEIEVESLNDARAAAAVLSNVQKLRRVPCFIMLDNMKPEEITGFVRELRLSKKFSNLFTEASGGINLQNVRQYAQTGVDILSVGAITHSAPALDISLKILSPTTKGHS